MKHDAQQIRADLATIADLHADLHHMLTSRPPGSTNAKTGHSKLAHPPAPVNLTALDMLDQRQKIAGDDADGLHQLDRMAGVNRMGILPDLWMWARMIESEMVDAGPTLPAELPEVPTLGNVCRWLSQAVEWAAGMQWWPEFAHDIHHTSQRVRRALGELDRNPTIHLGETGCGMPITEVGPERFLCSGCGKSWTLLAVTLPEASRRLKLNIRTLQIWAARSLLVEVPGTVEPPNGGTSTRRMFDLDSIRRIAAERTLRNA